jgi:hypothetical protein
MKYRKAPIIFVLALLTLFVIIQPAYASSVHVYPNDHLVLEAVSLFYTPVPDRHTEWVNEVCNRMTEGGCAYFTDRLEDTLWKSGQDIAFTSVVPGKVSGTLKDGSQVWRMEVAIYKTCHRPLKTCPSTKSDVYVHVIYDEAQEAWLLNRVLSGPILRGG